MKLSIATMIGLLMLVSVYVGQTLGHLIASRNEQNDCIAAGAVKTEVLPDGMVACFFENPLFTATGTVAPPAFKGPDTTDYGNEEGVVVIQHTHSGSFLECDLSTGKWIDVTMKGPGYNPRPGIQLEDCREELDIIHSYYAN